MGADGMKLYVDGDLEGTNANTQAQAYNGFWRLGGDTTWGSSSAYFAGVLDEAAVYPTVLSAGRVAAHFAAAQPAPNQLPTASFTTTCTDLDCTFDGTGSSDPDGTISSYAWDFGDGATATGPTPSHTLRHGGLLDGHAHRHRQRQRHGHLELHVRGHRAQPAADRGVHARLCTVPRVRPRRLGVERPRRHRRHLRLGLRRRHHRHRARRRRTAYTSAATLHGDPHRDRQPRRQRHHQRHGDHDPAAEPGADGVVHQVLHRPRRATSTPRRRATPTARSTPTPGTSATAQRDRARRRRTPTRPATYTVTLAVTDNEGAASAPVTKHGHRGGPEPAAHRVVHPVVHRPDLLGRRIRLGRPRRHDRLVRLELRRRDDGHRDHDVAHLHQRRHLHHHADGDRQPRGDGLHDPAGDRRLPALRG